MWVLPPSKEVCRPITGSLPLPASRSCSTCFSPPVMNVLVGWGHVAPGLPNVLAVAEIECLLRGGNGLGGNLGRDAEGGSSGLELVVDEGSDADGGLAVHGLGDRLDRLEVGDGIRGSTINSSSRDYRFAVIDPGVYFRAVSNSRGMS